MCLSEELLEHWRMMGKQTAIDAELDITRSEDNCTVVKPELLVALCFFDELLQRRHRCLHMRSRVIRLFESRSFARRGTIDALHGELSKYKKQWPASRDKYDKYDVPLINLSVES